MKKIFYIFVLFLASTLSFAEKITFTTGDMAGSSITDRFMPMDFSMVASQCTVSSIKKVEKELWSIKKILVYCFTDTPRQNDIFYDENAKTTNLFAN